MAATISGPAVTGSVRVPVTFIHVRNGSAMASAGVSIAVAGIRTVVRVPSIMDVAMAVTTTGGKTIAVTTARAGNMATTVTETANRGTDRHLTIRAG